MLSFDVDSDIQLRIVDTKYAEEMYVLVDRDRDYLREWLPWVDGTRSPEDTKDFIESSLQAFSQNNGFQTAIFYKENIVGCIGLHGIDWNNKKTTIGYWLSSVHQGCGIMTRSCRAIMNHLVHELKLHRVEIRAAVFNKRSRSIPERLGFSQEGILREAEWLYDHFVDHVVYRMLAADWNNLNK